MSSLVEQRAARLASNATGVEEKQRLVNEFRDDVEELMTGTASHQGVVMQSLMTVLQSIKPQKQSNAEHNLRKSILEVVNRVPHADAMRQHVSLLSRTLLDVATEDNEENAVVALRVMLDLVRAFKPPLEEVASRLLKLFIQLYGGWDEMCRFYFVDINRHGRMGDEVVNMDMQSSKKSFKVVAECPITVLYLLQLYGSEIKDHVPPLLSLMVKALRYESTSAVGPHVQQAYKDMKFAQVKTVAFLSHYVKQSIHLMQRHEREICDGLMHLLKSCPDVVQWRRELLISTRTLLATEFRKTLEERLNDLKDESAIVGSSRSCYEALRHYGYAVFAELAHQTRQKLKLDQLRWIVHRSCCISADTERPAASYSTAIRLLQNLVEVIHRLRQAQDGTLDEAPRELLQSILLCFVTKLNAIRQAKNPNAEVQPLLHNLFIGIRSVLFCLTTYNKLPGQSTPIHVASLKEQEIRLAVKIVKGGIEALKMCLRLKLQGNLSELMEIFVEVLCVLDPKDFVEIVSAKIGYLYDALKDQPELHPIIVVLRDKPKTMLYFLTVMIGFLADEKLDVLEDPDQEECKFLLKLCKSLLHILFKPEVRSVIGLGDPKSAPLVSTLVKMTRISIEKAKTTSQSKGYLQLLWFLFKYLNRAHLQFPDMASLLPSALDLFLSMLDGPELGISKDLLVELCLLLPLKLEKKYPVLPKLMKPLLMALKGTDDLALLGIQTMEEWIDRLNPDFLEIAMSALVQEINLALWSHLKPQHGNPLGPKVLQLLGKLGGRNRRFLAEPLDLEWKENQDQGLRLILTFTPQTTFMLPFDKCIELTTTGLTTKPSLLSAKDPENGLYYRRQGLQFLHACLATMMNLKDVATHMSPDKLKRLLLSGTVLPSSHPSEAAEHQGQMKTQYMAEKQTLKSLLVDCIVLCSDGELKDEAGTFARRICHHFAMLYHMMPSRTATEQARSFLQTAGAVHPVHRVKYLMPHVFVDALMQVLTDDRGQVAQCGADALRWFLEMVLAICQEKSMPIEDFVMFDETVHKTALCHRAIKAAQSCGMPDVVDTLVDRSIDCCFGDTSSVKRGGIYAFEVLIDVLPTLYLRRIYLQSLQSILHLTQSLPSHCITFRSALRNLLLKLTDRVIEAHAPEIERRMSMEDVQELTRPVGQLCETIFLLNAPENVRENCHACLSLLCRSFRKLPSEILDPFVALKPKSVRKYLEECIQSSYKFKSHNCPVSAFAPHMEGLSRLLIYCIQQRLPSVPPLLMQILECSEFAMLLCDASEEVMKHLLTSPRPDRLNVLSKMQESSLKMLVTLSSWDAFLNNLPLPEVKKSLESMTHLFFKTLISRDDKLRQISKTGLSTLLQKDRVTRFDCPRSLSPLLARLNRFSTLDLNLLKGSAEALVLISDWFNLILGEKLLDYLKKWLDPESGLHHQRSWPPTQDTEIAAAILEMFHLLPDPASTFLETQKTGTDRIGLVVLSIELEERLGQSSPVGPVSHILWSPYRAPLAKFLVKYKTESVAYFLAPTRMQNASYVCRFIDIIKSEVGQPLLTEVMNSSNQLIALLGNDALDSEVGGEMTTMASLYALQLIKTIVKLKPDWLPTQNGLYLSLFRLWQDIDMTERSAREASMTPAELFQCKAIAKCILNYVSVHHGAVDALVSLLTVFECSTKVDFKFIKTYCIDVVPEYPPHELQQLLAYVLYQLNDHMSQGQSIFVMRFLVLPILKSLNEKNAMPSVVSVDMMQLYLEKAMTSDGRRDVCLEMELLDVGRLLVMGVPHLCSDRNFQKAILKYPWSFLKCDNVECKSHAFLMIAHLLRSVRYTDRTILQIFVYLLKSDFSETKRELIQEALDVMVPALVQNFAHQIECGRFPQWIEHAIKHMQGEGHKVNLLVNLWQMVIGHPDLFYAYGSQFLGQMVNTLSRLRRPPANAAPENRQMAIDIERVIVDWEVKRIKESAEGSSVLPPPLNDETFANMKKMVVTLLAKTAFTVPPDPTKDASIKYTYGDILNILDKGLEIWPDVDFRLDFVERLIDGNQMNPQQLNQILMTGLDLVSLALEHQPKRFLESGWNHIVLLAQKVVAHRKEDLLEKLCKALEIVFSLDESATNIQMHLEMHIFKNYLDPFQVVRDGADHGIAACLRILESDRDHRTGILRPVLQRLVYLLEKYLKEYSVLVQNAAPASAAASGDAQTIPLPTFGQHTYNVCKIIQLCGGRLHDLGCQDRELFVVSMIRFLSWRGGRIPDRSMFYQILVVVSNWLREVIENGDSPALSQKLLLWSMQQICRLDANGLVEPVMKKHYDGLFLTAIYDVCTAPVLNTEFRRDVFAHVEQVLLCGIRTTTPDLRKKFFHLYQTSLGPTLFERLRFILMTQDWEHVASRFWLKQALDYLLALLKADAAIEFAPGSTHLVTFASMTTEALHHSVLHLSFETEGMDIDGERTQLDHLLADHLQFIGNKSSFFVDDLMGPLREYSHVNNSLSCHLWAEIFPIVWATLDKNSQMSLAKPPIISILSKQYHSVQAHHRPNVVQGLLKGISMSQPQPRIPPELIKYLGKTYNAWHIAITLLESRIAMFPDEARNFDALAELYRLLSETDIMSGLLKKGCKNPFTQAGINLMQYGYWEQAQHQFGVACTQANESMIPIAPAREVLLWSEMWCRCAKELNQWDELHTWAENSGSNALLADASWRLPNPDWGEMREVLQTSREQFPDKLQHLILLVYSSFLESSAAMSNMHITHAIEQCLQRWWQLPEIGTMGQVHLLQKFQQVVEVCESTRAFMELGPNRNGRREPSNFTKEILETWRLRSPNLWEPLSVWSEIFMWRHIIYGCIDSAVSSGAEPNSPSLHHLCIKDKACSINRLANVARKHGALDVCISIEHDMYNDNYMDIQEAFVKIVQQSKAYLLMDDQKMTGLSMLCSTNLEYFPFQGLQAEIFRLQGEYYRALDDQENATKSFSTSITLNHQLPETWLCWGAFCDDVYEKTKADTNGSSVQLEYAVGCYFQAMQLNSSAARAMIPRCLQLLSFDRTGVVDKVFKEQLHGADTVPSWYWLFYIPQILAVLDRPEGESLKYILPKIIQSHPQALFYFLRVHMLNMKEAASSHMEKLKQGRFDASTSASQSESVQHSTGSARDESYLMATKSNVQLNFEFVREWMDRLKLQLGPLSITFEVMLKEIASNFMAKPEERLMAVVHVLLARCCKAAGVESMEIPQGLIREIDGVCQACFPDSRPSTAVHKDLKEAFVQHLSPKAEGFPRTLGELTERLKRWRNMLSQYLDDHMPSTLQLHRESPILQELNLHGIEMPCQYSKSPEAMVDSPVYLEKISSEIHAIRRQGTAFRRIAFYDSDGRKTHFILQNGHTSGQPASSEERMLQLMSLINRLLNRHHQCRSRFLKFFAPVIVPVWNKVRLVEEDPCFTTFLEPLELNCQVRQCETDIHLMHFKQRIYSGEGPADQLKPAAYEKITEHIADNIFSRYMYNILPSNNHLWVFRKQFCSQMALSSLMSVMLSIGGRAPGKILFSRSTGKVLQVDFFPAVSLGGHVHQNDEAVPFRLTRNLTAFFTPFGVEGIFMTAMVTAAMAMTQRHSNLSSCLSLFFRDELLAWASRRESRAHLTANKVQLQPLVERNVEGAMNHVQSLCPVVPKSSPDDREAPPPVNGGVKGLVGKATHPHNLCQMDPTWHPWY